MTEGTIRSRPGAVRSLDRGLYALFADHADASRHERDRSRYRGAGLTVDFDVFVARVYGLAWSAAVGFALLTVLGVTVLPTAVVDGVGRFFASGLPVLNRVPTPSIPRIYVAVGAGFLVALVVRWAVIALGSRYLIWRASVRRDEIERTLPGAVRYLRVLASGTDDSRALLRRVADQDAYGATGTSFRSALNTAKLTGNLDEGLSTVARDTPSRDLLAPFLLKFREHAAQGGDALEGYLAMEGRLLSHRQERVRERVSGFLELIAELFVVLLIFPALVVLILTVAGVLAPGLSREIATPLGSFSIRTIVVYASVVFVLLVGAGAAATVASLRPTDQATPTYRRPPTVGGTVRSATTNPASAVVLALPAAVLVGIVLAALGYDAVNVVLLGYAAFAIPVGVVAVRRAGRDDAKDREIRDFVHAVSGHVSLGRPFSEAVRRVADDVDLGALQPDVDALAFNLGLTSGTESGTEVRADALDRFVDRVGTPLAAQTMGLVVGALESGSDTEQVFETLETEVGRLYHERKALRSRLLVYVAVGWTTALLVVGIVVAVNATVLDGFSQLSSVADASTGMAIDPNAIEPARDQARFYVVTQATVLACGWFAGMASRGTYEALLHSGILVGITYVVFAGMGMI